MAEPPISIGPFDNVPAPGSPIRSDWPQDITQWAVDTFDVIDQTLETIDDTFHANGRVQRGVSTVTTDVTGSVQVNYPSPFAGTAVAYVAWSQQGGGATAMPVFTVLIDQAADHFSVRLLNSSFAALASQPVTLSWIAVGPFGPSMVAR